MNVTEKSLCRFIPAFESHLGLKFISSTQSCRRFILSRFVPEVLYCNKMVVELVLCENWLQYEILDINTSTA